MDPVGNFGVNIGCCFEFKSANAGINLKLAQKSVVDKFLNLKNKIMK